jgi:hypothetical protein
MNARRVSGLTAVLGLLLGACGGGGASSPPVRAGSAPVIARFEASPSWVTTGQSSTLVWSVSGATSLSIDSLGAVTGTSVQVTPAADTSYVLTATNDSGSTRAQASVSVFQPPKAWFAPRPNLEHENYGSVDVVALFSPTAPWATAASHIQVFKLYTFEVDLFADADLTNLFADLKRRHIALALEWPGLTPDGCGFGIEGFDQSNGVETGQYYAQRIREHGGSLQYVAFDEPFYFGGIYSGTSACSWTPDHVAQNAAQTVAKIRSIFPDVIVGDIEVVPALSPAPGWLDGYQAWVDAWQRATGTPLAFFHFDVDWNSDWKPAVAALARALKLRHIPVGQIYIGSVDAPTDAAWVESAEQRLTDFETRGSPTPDQVIFQSWEALPRHVLPETDPTTFTHLIDRYYRSRTTLSMADANGSSQGQLTAATGAVANAAIQVTAVPFSGTGQATDYAQSSTVPSGTKYIVFGARVATECDLPPPSEFYLIDFIMDAGAAGQLRADFTNQLTGWGLAGNADIAQVENANLHVRANSGESLMLNSMSLPFSATTAITFTARAIIPTGSSGAGCAILVFQDAKFTELGRVSIPLVVQPIAVGSAQTASDGTYTLRLASSLPSSFELWGQYPGSDTLWPAAAAVRVGGAAALRVATAALPDGTVGSTYAQILTVSGGIAPYLWVAGPLPPGLTFRSDGTLSGTPAAAGTYTLSLSVIDHAASPQAADAQLRLVIH